MVQDVTTEGRPYPKLGELHQTMRRRGMSRVIFEGTNHESSVRTLFVADETPMVLCIAVTHPAGTPTCAFEWTVNMPGYRVNSYLGTQYRELKDALGLVPGQQGVNPFKTSDFLRNVLSQAPRALTAANEPRFSQIHRLRVRTTVEEADKIYFIGWRDNQNWGQHVTEANLHKTRKLIGADCEAMCRQHNMSTRWSDKPGRTGELTPSAVTRNAHQGFSGNRLEAGQTSD